MGVMIDEAFIDACVQRIRRELSRAVAIFLVGSIARGDAEPHSDLDFDVLVTEPGDESLTWLAGDDGRIVCVSVWVRSLAEWQAGEGQAQSWAFGLRCEDVVQLRWAADETWWREVERSRVVHPPAEPELEHVLDALAKVANAHDRGDDPGVRLAAQDLARELPALLAPLNPDRAAVTSRRAALAAALDFDIVPPGYRDDLVTCLGLAGTTATASEVRRAAGRLARGLIDLMAPHRQAFAGLVPGRLLAHLDDGTLRTYVDQLAGAGPASAGA
jgi:phosphoribosyl-AMP cyclohydrolase